MREWVESHWRWSRQHYEGIQEEQRRKELVEAFAGSDEFRALPPDVAEEASALISHVLDTAEQYCGATVESLDGVVLDEVLLEILPRKMSAPRETFETLAPAVAAFLGWLGSEGILDNGEALAEAVASWHERIVAASMDPSNWGFAKGIAMEAYAEGIDVADPEALRRYLRERSHRQVGRMEAQQASIDSVAPPVSVSSPPTVGRNDPCQCGSGKKYKQCCGRKAKRSTDGGD